MKRRIRSSRLRAATAVALGTFALLVLPQAVPSADAVVVREAEWPLDVKHLSADQVWHIAKGQGITVAVIDSGVQADHPDLVGQVLPGAGFLGDSHDQGQTDISSDSHGTAIAGIIAGTGRANNGYGMIGLAPKAKILPIRVDAHGAVEPTTLAQGITYAADHHAQVINISLGAPTPDPVLRHAVDYALGKDAVVVASAGNNGQSGDPAMYPAAFPGVIDVTGVDDAGRFWPVSESGPQTTLAAPATGIYSTNNRGQYVNAEGTSYATAYVSAAAALLRSAFPRLTAGQTIRRMITTADPHGHDADKGHDDQYGYGTLNILAALRSSAPPGNPANPLLSPNALARQTSRHSTTEVAFAAAGSILLASGTAALLWRYRRRLSAASGSSKRSAISHAVQGNNVKTVKSKGNAPATVRGGRKSGTKKKPTKRKR